MHSSPRFFAILPNVGKLDRLDRGCIATDEIPFALRLRLCAVADADHEAAFRLTPARDFSTGELLRRSAAVV
jgi:hypothetical protein